MNRLQSNFQPDKSLSVIFREQIENIVRQAIWTSADAQADNVFKFETNVIQAAQNTFWGVSVCEGLKITEKFFGFVSADDALYSRTQLFPDIESLVDCRRP
jgi:hypothetical protein